MKRCINFNLQLIKTLSVTSNLTKNTAQEIHSFPSHHPPPSATGSGSGISSVGLGNCLIHTHSHAAAATAADEVDRTGKGGNGTQEEIQSPPPNWRFVHAVLLAPPSPLRTS